MGGNPGKKRLLIGLAALVLVIGGVAGVLYATRGGGFQEPEAPEAGKSELARFATGSLRRLEAPAELAVAPEYVFRSPDGGEARFEDFRGRVTVVNLWAMWCAPCRIEMPTLAALQQAYPEDRLLVAAINVDTAAGEEEARAFLAMHEPLAFWHDPAFRLPFELPGRNQMPQTVILDREGRIRAWMAGEADWNGPEARALIDALLGEST